MFKNFKDINNEEIVSVLEDCESILLFNDIDDYFSLIGDGCFFLNLISSYVFLRVSEKVV